MQVDLTVQELEELITAHHSAAIEAGQAGNFDKMKYHESRRTYLIELTSAATVKPTLNTTP